MYQKERMEYFFITMVMFILLHSKEYMLSFAWTKNKYQQLICSPDTWIHVHLPALLSSTFYKISNKDKIQRNSRKQRKVNEKKKKNFVKLSERLEMIEHQLNWMYH